MPRQTIAVAIGRKAAKTAPKPRLSARHSLRLFAFEGG
jgi:hypothetical protein